MRTRAALCAVLLAAGAALAAGPGIDPAPAEAPGSRAQAAPADSPAGEEEGRRDYELRARRRLELLRLQLTDAELAARRLGAEARRDADARVARLRAQTDEAQKDLSELQRAAQRTWNTVRRRLDGSLEALRREYEGLKRDLEKD